MKKLVFAAAVVAMSCGLMAEEVKNEVSAPAPVAVTNGAKRARQPFDRAKFEARMRERAAERLAKMCEVLKKYGLDEEKAKACAEELMKIGRPQRPRRPPKSVEAAPAALPKAEGK